MYTSLALHICVLSLLICDAFGRDVVTIIVGEYNGPAYSLIKLVTNVVVMEPILVLFPDSVIVFLISVCSIVRLIFYVLHVI